MSKVYVTASRRRNSTVYHTRMCANAPSNPQERELDHLGSEFEECKCCQNISYNEGENTTHECPYCGQEVKVFGHHLPCDNA